MRALATILVSLAMLGPGCAVKGYELGWRTPDQVSALLGEPRDALSGCVVGAGRPGAPVCAEAAQTVGAMLARLPPQAGAPEALGFRCRAGRCAYANVWQRRDVGAAGIVPVYRRVVLREVRMSAVRAEGGRWRLEGLSIRDPAAPSYGPITVGGRPPTQ